MNKSSAFLLGLLLPCALWAQPRTETLLERGWLFSFNGAPFQEVTVPHDWAIYGPFSVYNDQQHTAIVQDGQTEAMEHAGRTGGLPFVGKGVYKLSFARPQMPEGGCCTLLFDGAMSHARIFVNGKEAGYWPYGYNSFHIDITPFLQEQNLLEVHLQNETDCSRWYPGAGLYRNVHLIVTSGAHVPVWGTQITTPIVTPTYATVRQVTGWELPQGKSMRDYTIVTQLHNAEGHVVATAPQNGTPFSGQTFVQELVIENPELWSFQRPYLYTSVSKIFEGNTLVDEYTTTFGIRTIELRPNSGFYLNGELVKFQGVCNHHDLGPLGGIANEAGIRRQIRILKDMGCNAIRTSHNMPAPELVKACDEMGMMLMAESFDEWEQPKVKNGYHLHFAQWAERDIVNLVHRYRNNPSVVMWCIGNEVPDQWRANEGPKWALWLQQICHREDPTRPVTQGMDAPDAVLNNGMAALMDVPGFNYRPHRYQEAYAKLPQQFILGSETASTVSSRGVYKFPVVRRSMQQYEDHQASAYDVEHCSWSNLPEDDFIQHDDLPYCMGEFVWTGFDYLGEPTPYYSNWPSHSSLFGIVDLAGIPKDRYYLYRSHWNPTEPTLHLLPHWNWKGREGQITPIFVYTNYPSAELFINGKSQGVRTKDTTVTIANSADSLSQATFKRQTRYRLMWMDTRYEPGVVRVVAYNEAGEPVMEQEMRTAGKPHHIELEADRTQLQANGKDLAFVRVRVVDRHGQLCPLADNLIQFTVHGAGAYRAGANGNAASLESFQEPQMKVFMGQMTAIVTTLDYGGSITLEAKSPGLRKATITLSSN